ncbi:MAG TPA: apolipoprotein N-acyltransferase [Syntrophales bacterium]|nr:apolipoprotein N-acyltransferase [Syntrophales bacterium]
MKLADLRINRNTLFLSAASGILLFLSFPKFGSWITAWVALVSLFFALRDVTLWQGLIAGFTAGLVFNIGIMYWITFVVVHYGHLPYSVGVLLMLFVAAYLAIYVALFAGGVVYFRGRGIPAVVAAPVLWTCLEYAKSQLLTGFPWENLSYSQYLNRFLIQVVDITGPYGISFIVVLINVVLFNALVAKGRGRRTIVQVALAIVTLACVYTYGYIRVNQIDRAVRTAEAAHVTLVQGNIDQSIKWNPEFQAGTVDVYRKLSLENRASGPGLTVWPETAAPFFFQDASGMRDEVEGVARASGEWLLFGSPSYSKNCDGDNSCVSFLNSAYLLSPQARISGRYDKVHLVPFGEYVPLRRFFPFVNKLVVGVGDFGRGNGYHPVDMNGHKLGVLICYEGIFPEASRAYRNEGADLLVNITNDAWFGKSSAPYQHLSMTVFRAVEDRAYLVRSANTGISAIVDPTGRITAQTELFERTALSGTVRFMEGGTFYATHGDTFVAACALALISSILISLRRRNAYTCGN